MVINNHYFEHYWDSNPDLPSPRRTCYRYTKAFFSQLCEPAISHTLRPTLNPMAYLIVAATNFFGISINSIKRFVVPPGFEPGQTEPKSVVLPLHHGTILSNFRADDGTRTHEILLGRQVH